MRQFNGGFGGARAVSAVALASAIASISVPAVAQNATWNDPALVAGPVAGTFNYNDSNNWTPATVPAGVAIFGSSITPNLSFSSNTTASAWSFAAGASNYTFDTNGQLMTFTGSGIVLSGGSATFNSSSVRFQNSGTAGSTTFNNSTVEFEHRG
jgi:hypothetical protein